MANICQYMQKAMLDWVLLGAAPTRPASVLVGLSIGAPSSTSNSEVGAGSGYARGIPTFGAAGTPASILPGSSRISAARVIEMAPAVRHDGLDGGLLAYDGQLIDDARLVAAVARTAAQHGARILTYTAASEVTGMSLRLTDQRSGESFDTSARPGCGQVKSTRH